jgi:hypothetical protein
MIDHDGSRPMRVTEPKPVQLVFAEGIRVEARDETVRLIGWIDLSLAPGQREERRIVLRVALPSLVARALVRDMRRVLARGGN